MNSAVDTDDVQSLVFGAHLGLPHAMAMWLEVRDAAAARASLRGLVDDGVSFGLRSSGGPGRASALQLGLTAAGLDALGVRAEHVAGLGDAFRGGIIGPHRSRALGDVANNAPDGWSWNDRQTHALLLLYRTDAQQAETESAALLDRLGAAWLCALRMPISLSANRREPFGFRDGLVRTRIDIGDGTTTATDIDLLPPGEVLLGQRSATGIVAPVSALARNGSYLAVRQLQQDVQGFWRHWMSQGASEEEAVWLAAKAVGRWPNGMPVDGYGTGPEPPYDAAVATGALSFRDDPLGDRLPLGSHIRRANPRDGLNVGPDASAAISAQHRILRRGRRYGAPVPSDWFPSSIADAAGVTSGGDASGERGLLFMGLCADLVRQFEFIQQTWLNNPKQAGLIDEVDPIAGGRGIVGDNERFTIPRDPLRRRLEGVSRWVTVRGAGYFFLPGHAALQSALAG